MTREMRKSASGGFTLVELLVVLLIAVLIVSLSRPMYSAAFPGTRVRAETRALVATLHASASRAISSGRAVTVKFSAEPAGYVVAGKTPVELPGGVELDIDTVSGSGTVAVGREQPDSVHFYPDGSSSGAAIDLRGGPVAYRVTIDWLTGAIHISESDRG